MAKPKLILLTIVPIFPTPPSHQMMHPMKERLTASSHQRGDWPSPFVWIVRLYRNFSHRIQRLAALSAVPYFSPGSVMLVKNWREDEARVEKPVRPPSKHKRSCSSNCTRTPKMFESGHKLIVSLMTVAFAPPRFVPLTSWD